MNRINEGVLDGSSVEGQTWEGDQVSNILIQTVQPKLSSDGLLRSQIDLVQPVDFINLIDHISDIKLIEEQSKDSKLKLIIDWWKNGIIPKPDELYLSNQACMSNWLNKSCFDRELDNVGI